MYRHINNHNNNKKIRNTRKNLQTFQSPVLEESKKETTLSIQIPSTSRRNEIRQYLEFFGYKPQKTILQVYVAGFFRKRGLNQKQIEQRAKTISRYGGTSFTVVGRTHDPTIMERVIKPKKRNLESSSGYIGYLWKGKNPNNKAPHELLPLDFTPIHLPYPTDWKKIFATKGFLIVMHVPTSFVKDKNKITRALYRIAKTEVNTKDYWNFLADIKSLGYNN